LIENEDELGIVKVKVKVKMKRKRWGVRRRGYGGRGKSGESRFWPFIWMLSFTGF
jgi:hypothetical protein